MIETIHVISDNYLYELKIRRLDHVAEELKMFVTIYVSDASPFE